MVSTRGGARTGPVAEPGQSLRKKPVRKAMTKPTTATEPQATQPKEKVVTQATSRPTSRAASTLGKPAKTAQPIEKVVTQTAARPASRTASTLGRSTKNAHPIETKNQRPKSRLETEKTPSLPAATQSRATRPTRATEAKAKAQPLSPKKVTQVARAPARHTRAATSKTQDKKKPPAKAVAATRTAGRRRAVSNENEDPAQGTDDEKEHNEASQVENDDAAPPQMENIDTAPPAEESQEPIPEENTRLSPEPVIESTTVTPQKKTRAVRSSRRIAAKEEAEIEEDHAEALTVTESQSQSEDEIAQPQGALGNKNVPVEIEDADNDEDFDDVDVSVDELCGPKTPMKRSSPRETSKYLSPLRTVLPIRTTQQTPAQRLMILSTRQGTPHTDKPSDKLPMTMSEKRSMTVARPNGRVIDFSKLSLLPDIKMSDDSDSEEGEEGEEVEEDDSDYAAGRSDGSEDADTSSEMDETEDTVDILQESSLQVESHVHQRDEEMEGSDAEEPQPTAAQDHTQPTDDTADEDTILMNEDVDENDFAQSLEVEPDQIAVEGDDPIDTQLEAKDLQIAVPEKPEPETLVWSSLVQDAAAHEISDSSHEEEQFLPQTDATEMLTIVTDDIEGEPHTSSLPSMTPRTRGAWSGALTEADTAMAFAPLLSTQRLSVNIVRESYDATVNISDFIDVDSLSGPTQSSTPLVKMTLPRMSQGDSSLFSSTATATSLELPTTPSRSQQVPVNFAPDNDEDLMHHSTPRYALPTIASMTRRKSLPSFGFSTPFRINPRPNTSDGSGGSRSSVPKHILDSWTTDSEPLVCPRFTAALSQDNKSSSIFNTDTSFLARASPSRGRYSEIPSFDFSHKPNQSPSMRHPRAQTPAGRGSLSRVLFSTPDHFAKNNSKTHGELSKTATVPTRFLTSTSQVLGKRPSTSQKPAAKRRLTFRVTSPHLKTSTPTRTPLKSPARLLTPGMAIMTPHPSAPLRSVVALVEVYTNDGAPASAAFTSLLQRLGARTTKSWSERVTHVVFKEGSPTTLQRVRQRNQTLAKSGTEEVYCVNSRWVSDCDSSGRRMDEFDDAYAVPLFSDPSASVSAKRRRKSMEPATLVNIAGNLVRDRQASLGRRSLSRSLAPSDDSPRATDSPLKIVEEQEKENTPSTAESQLSPAASFDSSSSPATPAYLAAPSSLLQQTVPAQRIRRLDLGSGRGARRLRLGAQRRQTTLWPMRE